MTFTVTYRAKDGALREERVEAANRAECVAECRRRGIVPTKIAEGRSGKSAASPMGRDRRGHSRVGTGDSKRTTARWMAVAVVAVVAIAGGAWWWIGGRGATALPAEKPAKPKVEKPQKPKATSVQQQGGGRTTSVQQQGVQPLTQRDCKTCCSTLVVSFPDEKGNERNANESNK